LPAPQQLALPAPQQLALPAPQHNTRPRRSIAPQELNINTRPRRSIKRRGTDSNLPVAKQPRNWAQVHPLFANRGFHINLSPNWPLPRHTQQNGR
jgi:uncharacterized lipoprotein